MRHIPIDAGKLYNLSLGITVTFTVQCVLRHEPGVVVIRVVVGSTDVVGSTVGVVVGCVVVCSVVVATVVVVFSVVVVAPVIEHTVRNVIRNELHKAQ